MSQIVVGSFCPIDWSTGIPIPFRGDEGPIVELFVEGEDYSDISDNSPPHVEYLADVFPGYQVVDKPLPWQEQGLQQTASGYGAKLTSRRCVKLPGENRLHRVYITRFGNAGSAWITYKGRKLHLMDSD